MPRPHLFATIVLLAAAALAGLLAVTRTADLGAAAAPPAADAQISARMHSLDRLEASLRRALEKQPPALPAARPKPKPKPAAATPPPVARTVYVRQAAPLAQAAPPGHEDEHGDEGREHESEGGGEDD